MKSLFRRYSPASLAAIVVLAAGCGYVVAGNPAQNALSSLDKKANGYVPFLQSFPDNPELNNYQAAQKLYADKTTIIYCTTTWGNASAPLVTIPVAGKLTSSSVSYFPSSRVRFDNSTTPDEYTPERRSVDGLYHGSPPPYRYGFTPGGQYVDFFNMPTFCTTALTKFQRQNTKVTIDVDSQSKAADAAAQNALKRGDKAEANRILSALDNSTEGK